MKLVITLQKLVMMLLYNYICTKRENGNPNNTTLILIKITHTLFSKVNEHA